VRVLGVVDVVSSSSSLSLLNSSSRLTQNTTLVEGGRALVARLAVGMPGRELVDATRQRFAVHPSQASYTRRDSAPPV